MGFRKELQLTFVVQVIYCNRICKDRQPSHVPDCISVSLVVAWKMNLNFTELAPCRWSLQPALQQTQCRLIYPKEGYKIMNRGN